MTVGYNRQLNVQYFSLKTGQKSHKYLKNCDINCMKILEKFMHL